MNTEVLITCNHYFITIIFYDKIYIPLVYFNALTIHKRKRYNIN